MRSAINKKGSQDEQQNQTTITTNINYFQNFDHFEKKNNKIRAESDKIETKQSNLYITRKDMWPLHNTAW